MNNDEWLPFKTALEGSVPAGKTMKTMDYSLTTGDSVITGETIPAVMLQFRNRLSQDYSNCDPKFHHVNYSVQQKENLEYVHTWKISFLV